MLKRAGAAVIILLVVWVAFDPAGAADAVAGFLHQAGTFFSQLYHNAKAST